jgi:hypothetical protein
MKQRNRTTLGGIAIFISAILLFSSGCSTRYMLKTTANAISPFVPEGVHMVMAGGVNTSYGQGMYAVPGLIALVGGFSEVAPNNYTLAWSASQIYVATACYNEMSRTDYASELAWQGYRFGMRSLMTHKKFRKAIESGTPVEKAVELLPKKYVQGLTWTSMSLALWMMMNLNDIMALSYAPEVNTMVKRACELDGSYYFALPYMLDAVFSSLASEMVQGCGFDRARQSYAKMKELNGGKLLLADCYWAQLYAVGIRDRKLYKELLQGVINAPDDILEYHGFYITTLAKGRAKWLLERQEMVFQNMGTVR